jgi:hypothetical protein
MLTLLAPFSLLLATTTLLHYTTAFPSFTSSTVAYFTNCETSDTLVFYSEVSIYSDVAQSFNGENPEAYDDTPLGGTTTWEGTSNVWSYPGDDAAQPDSFFEFINANAQDRAVPAFTQVGCAVYTPAADGGAIAFQFSCYKDNPRVLYTTSDHECTTVYYCEPEVVGTECPFTPPGKKTCSELCCVHTDILGGTASLVVQAKDL